MPFDPNLFRQVLGRFTTGVTVITTAHHGVKHGMTANAFSSVSLNPPLILISVDKRANMHELLNEGDAFCVNILAEHHQDWSGWWAGKAPKEGDQFVGIPHTTKATGSPVLDECVAYIDCTVWARYPGGDHTVFVGEVQEAGLSEDANLKPLLFFASRYRTLTEDAS